MKDAKIILNTSSYTEFITPKLNLIFSYDVIIAYWTRETGVKISENDWTRTTGTHIGKVMKQYNVSKKNLMPRKEFEKGLKEVLTKHNLI